MKLLIPKSRLFHSWGSAPPFNSTTYLNENERHKNNTNLFMSITIALFVSITWHKKEPLCCVLYWHCPNNDSYNKCIHSCCLPCNYVTKSFGILQRVINSQKMYIYHLGTAKFNTFSLREVCDLNFQTCL